MKSFGPTVGLLIVNLTVLIGALVIAAVSLNLGPPPHPKGSAEEIRAHIQQLTHDEKLQEMFAAEDEEIRAMCNLAGVYRKAVIWMSFGISCALATNLVVNRKIR